MANYGRKGRTDSLVPFEPIPRLKSCDIFEDHWLEELGLASGGPRAQLQEESDAEFLRAAGAAHDAVLTEEQFIAVAAQLWAFDRRSARACFHASDLDQSGRMNKREYLLFREAFVHPPTEAGSSHEAVRCLQLRAVFHKYVLSRPGKRKCDVDEIMTSDELFEWVRDLCAGDEHVSQVASDLLPIILEGAGTEPVGTPASATPTRGQLTMERFVQALDTDELGEHLRSHGLTVRNIANCLRSTGRGQGYPHRFARAVIDGRSETAWGRMPWYSTSRLTSRSCRKGTGCACVESHDIHPDAVNADMELDPHVRAVGGWRGPLAPGRQTEEYKVATQVIDRCMHLASQLNSQADTLDCNWLPKGAVLRLLLGSDEVHQAKCIKTLARACQAQLAAQPSLVRVTAPTKVFGDVHGQLRDLLLLFGLYGLPTHCGGDVQTTSYVFNGDWVDRGEHQLEVVLLLFALKTIYPAQVFLVRGNHEFRDMSEGMQEDGFRYHMQQRLPEQWWSCYEALHEAFDWLPLAALVGGAVLVLHGGIGDGSWGIKDLERVQRPLRWDLTGCVLDALWSDPTDSDDWMSWGVHANEERGLGSGVTEFGPDVTAKFCRREGISIIVRSHQYVRQGYKVMHSGHLITLFSARNYFGEVGEESNDGAMLLLAPDVNGHLRVHPKRLVKLEDTSHDVRLRLVRSMPCLGSCISGLRRKLLTGG